MPRKPYAEAVLAAYDRDAVVAFLNGSDYNEHRPNQEGLL